MDHFSVDVDRCPRCNRTREGMRVRVNADPCRSAINSSFLWNLWVSGSKLVAIDVIKPDVKLKIKRVMISRFADLFSIDQHTLGVLSMPPCTFTFERHDGWMPLPNEISSHSFRYPTGHPSGNPPFLGAAYAPRQLDIPVPQNITMEPVRTHERKSRSRQKINSSSIDN